MLDYPEKTACIVFTAGCNFRCKFCHNPEFVLPEQLKKIKSSFIPKETFFNFLKSRKGLLDGVVVTGGEPTMQGDLLEFLDEIKKQGFLVKLDSNGNNPFMLKKALDSGLVDYVAMDVKADLENYADLVGNLVHPDFISMSIELIKKSGLPYEFRSTLIKEIHTDDMFKGMSDLVKGSEKLYLQQFRTGNTLDPTFEKCSGFSKGEMEQIADTFFREIVDLVEVRT